MAQSNHAKDSKRVQDAKDSESVQDDKDSKRVQDDDEAQNQENSDDSDGVGEITSQVARLNVKEKNSQAFRAPGRKSGRGKDRGRGRDRGRGSARGRGGARGSAQGSQKKAAWHGPTKQSAFVILIGKNNKVYAVRNSHGKIGVPGGKRDEDDYSIFATAKREFQEETGVSLPQGVMSHFEWGDTYHTIRIFYRELSEQEAGDLSVGNSPDDESEEVETFWASVDGSRSGWRPHIRVALGILDAIYDG